MSVIINYFLKAIILYILCDYIIIVNYIIYLDSERSDAGKY